MLDRIPRREARLYQGVLIQCQSYHGDYVSLFSKVAVSGGSGMSFSTQVPVVRHAWTPATMSCRVKHLMLPHPEALALVVPIQY
jgi:hypothetical protein